VAQDGFQMWITVKNNNAGVVLRFWQW